MSLQMRTPAQAAKIELNLGRNRIRSMIEILLTFIKTRFWLTPKYIAHKETVSLTLVITNLLITKTRCPWF